MKKSCIPNIFTFINLSLGILSLLSTFEGNYQLSCILILLAALVDRYDGRIARYLQVTPGLIKLTLSQCIDNQYRYNKRCDVDPHFLILQNPGRKQRDLPCHSAGTGHCCSRCLQIADHGVNHRTKNNRNDTAWRPHKRKGNRDSKGNLKKIRYHNEQHDHGRLRSKSEIKNEHNRKKCCRYCHHSHGQGKNMNQNQDSRRQVILGGVIHVWF